jgi:serine/threonine protein kinase
MPRTSDHVIVNEIFENEVKILDIFDHQNILKCYNSNDKAIIVDSKQINIPVYAIELEYAENGDFFDIVEATGKFSEKDARFYFHQLISAIEYIHGMGY